MAEVLTSAQLEEAAAVIRGQIGRGPSIALVLGSGLSGLGKEVERATIIPYGEIPHWPVSTVAGHGGRLVAGSLEGKTVLVMQGRVHFYEGLPIDRIVLPVRVMLRLGVKMLIVTNAAGGLNPAYRAGDIMIIRDHLNLPGMAGHHPLRGPNDDSVGPRFPDMTFPYDRELRELCHEAAREHDFSLREGVYAYVAGPSYETPAELRFLHRIGADAVGMSTVPSVVVARHGGMRVLGISTITNMASLEPNPDEVTSHEEVLEVGRTVVPRLTALLRGVLRRL